MRFGSSFVDFKINWSSRRMPAIRDLKRFLLCVMYENTDSQSTLFQSKITFFGHANAGVNVQQHFLIF